jgi:3-oxoacyl-[acyl-carrier-protein] synthase III
MHEAASSVVGTRVVKIGGTGSSLPEKVLTNPELERMGGVLHKGLAESGGASESPETERDS